MISSCQRLFFLTCLIWVLIDAFHFYTPSIRYPNRRFSSQLHLLPETAELLTTNSDLTIANAKTFLDFFNIFSFFDIVSSKQDSLIAQIYDPSNFQPVCPASDAVYQVTKAVSNNLVGQENVAEYGPLIASVLLRVRLELCVVESFIYEAVVPFIQQKGLSWVLPLHETFETFLTGTVFAIAMNVILLGSTKILSILLLYLDVLFGFPIRLFGRLFQTLTKKKNDPIKSINAADIIAFMGESIGLIRRIIEHFDSFVGTKLAFATTLYILFKFLHLKLFNNLP